MSVESADTVDAIGVDKITGDVVLTAIDPSSWEDEEKHIELLQAKLNTYLRFLEGGEIFQTYPQASGRRLLIRVIAQFKPTNKGLEFLKVSKRTIEEAGFGFEFELRS